MTEHGDHTEHKHVLEDRDLTPYQRFMAKVVWKLLELSTLEVVIALAHLTLFFCVVFFGVGKASA